MSPRSSSATNGARNTSTTAGAMRRVISVDPFFPGKPRAETIAAHRGQPQSRDTCQPPSWIGAGQDAPGSRARNSVPKEIGVAQRARLGPNGEPRSPTTASRPFLLEEPMTNTWQMSPTTGSPVLVRLGAVALAVSGWLFFLYPVVRPWRNESTIGGAVASMSSDAWVAAHLFAVFALILMPLDLVERSGYVSVPFAGRVLVDQRGADAAAALGASAH